MRIVPTAVALLAALTLAACSSSSAGDPTTAPSSPPVSVSSEPSSSVASSPAPSSSVGSPSTSGLTEAQAKAALLTVAEIGGDFTQTPSDTSDSPLPCTPNDPPLDQQFPPTVKVESDFTALAGKALFSEEIETFADAGTVAKVIAGGEKGLACKTTTEQGVKITISDPTELTTAVDTTVDKAEGWSITSTAVNASLIIAQLGQHLVVFSFAADPSVKSNALPNAQNLVNAALAKVDAALK